jgi:hypothetical protein
MPVGNVTAAAKHITPADVTPATERVYEVERKYSGKNFVDGRMVAKSDVQAAINALGNGKDVSARAALADFLYAFGGNQFNPKSSFAPADREAIKAAVLKGIDTPAKLAQQSPSMQAAVLAQLAFLPGNSDALGIKTDGNQADPLTSVGDASARAKLAAAIKDIKVPAGYPKPQLTIERASLDGKALGYSIEMQCFGPGMKTFHADLLANANGDVVSRNVGVAPAEHDPPDD